MNKKIASEIAIGVILILAIVIGGIFYLQNKESKKNIAPTKEETELSMTENKTIYSKRESQKAIGLVEETTFFKQMKNNIEDWSSYTSLNNTEYPMFGIEECENEEAEAGYRSFIEKANRDVKMKYIFKGAKYSVQLYITPDYEEHNYVTLDKCSGGLGSVYPMKEYPDYIVWGNMGCGGGVGESSDSSYFDEFVLCNKLYADIRTYFSLKEAVENNNQANEY